MLVSWIKGSTFMDDKSIFFDASPSWNGFGYQGRVGIYVVLNLLLEKANSNGID